MDSGFGDFVRQPFVGVMLGMVCFLGVLLVVTLAALIYVRRRRAQRRQLVSSGVSFSPMGADSSDANMPDLSLLVSAPVAPGRVSPPIMEAAPAPTVAPARSARKGTFSITPQDGSQTEAVEVMTLLRDVTDGRLMVQMGDKTYQDVSVDAEFKERFSKLMREVGQMMPKAATSAPQMESRAEASNSEPVENIEIKTTPADVKRAAEPAFLKPKPSPPNVQSSPIDGKIPGDLPSYKLDDNPMPKLRRGQKPNLEPVPEVNIAGAIESYLQHKLRQTGEFAGRSIHIYPASDGGVSIEVDGQYFEAVSDVADNSVREFLAQTIQEWQERH